MAEEDVKGRVMPHSIEAEQSVIGAMLMDSEAIEIASEMLREEDFYARQYGVLFSAILEMHTKGEAVDPVTLQTRLREKNLPPENRSPLPPTSRPTRASSPKSRSCAG